MMWPHIRTEYGLADSRTKTNVNPEALINTVDTGNRIAVDCIPLFRTTLRHKAHVADWANGDKLSDVWGHKGAIYEDMTGYLGTYKNLPEQKVSGPWTDNDCNMYGMHRCNGEVANLKSSMAPG